MLYSLQRKELDGHVHGLVEGIHTERSVRNMNWPGARPNVTR